MATRLEKLMFRIGVKDDASGPVGKLQKALRSTSRLSKQAWGQLAGGAMTAVGAGLALEGMVSPALDLNRALADVSSLDVDAKGLKLLDATAKQYAMSYGGTAASFVKSSYDIQSGIAGLNGVELSSYTYSLGVLGKATKASEETMTRYGAIMYNIFKNQADTQGKTAWIEDLAGKTALAVQKFRTDGTQMAEAFSSLGANATSAGVKMDEQVAILGRLQGVMSGSEAGTKYKAFLAGVGNAQKELGLRFVDSQGHMLPVLQILEKLRKKYGSLKVLADSDILKKGFGSDEAVSFIKQLLPFTGNLAQDIEDIGKTKGMGKAEAMARKMVDPFHKLNAALNTVSAAWWQKLLPPVNDAVEAFNRFMGKVLWFIDTFPNITRQLGYVALTVSLSAVAFGLFNVVAGLAKLGVLGLFNPFSKLIGFLFGTKAAGTGAAGGVGGLVNIFGVLKKAWLLFNSAILGTPAGWVLIGLIAVIAALAINWEDFKKNFGDTAFGSAVIQMVQDVCAWWDRLTNAFSEGSWSKIFIEIINAVTAPLRKFLELVGWALEKVGLIDKDSSFYGMTTPLDEKAFETVGKVAGGLEMQTPDYLSGMPGTYSPLPQGYPPPEKPKTTGGTHSWFRMQTPDYTMGVPSGSAALSPDRGIPQKLVPTFQGMQYGSGLTATAGALNRQGQTPAPSPAIASLNAPRTLDVPRGGIMKSVTNTTTNTQNRNRSVNIATAHFNMTDGMSVADVAEEFSLAMPG